MGGDVKENPNNDDEKDINAIIYALKSGINHIDTSESYSGGKSEKLIGEAIKNFDRDKLFIATKVREWNLTYDNIISSCCNSLKRLQTDYVDLFYIHKQNKDVNIKSVCEALNYLLAKGLIKNVGLSNVGIDTIQKYNKYLTKKIYAVQNQYNLICRESQKKGVIDYCRENNILFDLLISIEGGYEQIDNTYFIVTYASIVDQNGNEFIGKSTGLQITENMFDYVKEGKSLNKVIESIINSSSNKKGNGITGYLTNGYYRRDIFESSAVISAMQTLLNFESTYKKLEKKI